MRGMATEVGVIGVEMFWPMETGVLELRRRIWREVGPFTMTNTDRSPEAVSRPFLCYWAHTFQSSLNPSENRA